jgi:hypothetical protein
VSTAAPPSGPPAEQPSGGSGGVTITGRTLGIIGLVVVIIVAAIVGVVALGGGSDDSASAAEVELQPIATAGTNPFMPSVGTDQTGVTPPPAATSATGSVATYSGDTPGLYGGTRNVSTCDPDKMVAFLEANPDKAAAWAGVLGIQTTEIRTYVSSLTPVILRTDTYVTNHGFENGRATEIDAVLQAGTAVLIDKYGFPVTKCYCGNPLTRPRVYVSPRYTGPRWPAFTPTSITVIQQTTVVINIFTLVDARTGQPFNRPAGTGGTGDTDAPNFPTTTTTTPTTTRPSATTLPSVTVPPQTDAPTAPPTAPPTQPQGPTLEQQEQAASDRVSQASQQCYPFPAPIEDSTGASTSFSDVTPTSFVITVVTQLTHGGTQTFSWRVDRASGAFTPLNDLAQVASGHCSLLN